MACLSVVDDEPAGAGFRPSLRQPRARHRHGPYACLRHVGYREPGNVVTATVGLGGDGGL